MHRQVSKYEIVEELAHSRWGRVHKAVDTTIGNRVVAIRLIEIPPAEISELDEPLALQQFKYEAQITARLNHPQIAQVLEYGIDKENPISPITRRFVMGGIRGCHLLFGECSIFKLKGFQPSIRRSGVPLKMTIIVFLRQILSNAPEEIQR